MPLLRPAGVAAINPGLKNSSAALSSYQRFAHKTCFFERWPCSMRPLLLYYVPSIWETYLGITLLNQASCAGDQVGDTPVSVQSIVQKVPT